jgi:acyl-coenzyme A synthetase/AMP-(fatty) acid ligase
MANEARGILNDWLTRMQRNDRLRRALAILAITRIGAVFSVVFGGFASKELAKRIEDSKCKMIITSSCGLEPKGVSLCRYLNRLPPCMVSR